MRIDEILSSRFTVKSTKLLSVLDDLKNFAKTLSPDKIIGVRDFSVKVWTRGDGTRYKEPLSITMRTEKDAKKIFDLIDGKSLEVSGEFGSSKFTPAKKSKGFLFVLADRSIRVSSDSVLRNKDLWRSKDAN